MVGFSVDAGVEQHVLVGGKLPQVTVHDTLQLVRGGTHGLHLGVQVVARKVGCGRGDHHNQTQANTHKLRRYYVQAHARTLGHMYVHTCTNPPTHRQT